MFKHVALWKFSDDDNPVENRKNAIKIKALFEELVYEVHGLNDLNVHIDAVRWGMANADIFMEGVFESRDAYRNFLEHPRRLAVTELLESCTEDFLCMDIECGDFDPTDIPGETASH